MEAQASSRPDAAEAIASGLLATRCMGMSDPETATTQVQRLRSDAAARLNDAAQCSDPAQRDGLVSEALALLAQARVLRNQAECDLQMPGDRESEAAPTSTRLQ